MRRHFIYLSVLMLKRLGAVALLSGAGMPNRAPGITAAGE
jgi:hypothetical protein